ncbi:MAG: hypothetical protein JW712_14015 [Dehalococcoidales bacterium]|nr:hypothetical protein [Dehalococcoidales bacterium]
MTGPHIGAEVIDSNGNILGTIDYIVRDSWSGDIRKYIIYKKPPEKDLSFTPENIIENSETSVKVNISPG